MLFFGTCSIPPNQQIFRNYIIFSLLAKCNAASWNDFTGRIWPVSRCVKNSDIDWRVVTAYTIAGVQHQSWKVVIYLRRHGHNFLSRNTVTWRPARGTSQHRTPQHPQNISRGTRQYTFHTFLRSTKHVYTYLACSQGFLKICWSGKLFCSATAATKTALGIIQLWFNYFRGIMASTLPGRLSKEMSPELVHSLLTPVLCMEMINLPIFRCPSKTPCHSTHNQPAF